MNLEALGAELLLEMTDDGRPALRCPLHRTLMALAVTGDSDGQHRLVLDGDSSNGGDLAGHDNDSNSTTVTLESPCGCSCDDVLAYYAAQSPMLAAILEGGDADESRSERIDHINADPPEGATNSEGPYQPGSEVNSQGQNNGNGAGGQQLESGYGGELLKRVPPQDILAEQSVLGAILINDPDREGEQRKLIDAVCGGLVPESFYRESHREILRAIIRLDERREPVDAITLNGELRDAGVLEAVGGMGYLAELAATVPGWGHALAHVDGWVARVRLEAQRRDLASMSTALASAAYDRADLTMLTHRLARISASLQDNHQPRLGVVMLNQAESVELNAKYLARPEIIERLGYAESICLIIGGKHHGKTTNIRTLALSVCRGLPIWGRRTTQGPVLYMASDDELASTRNELLRMGWSPQDALKLGHIDPETDSNADQILNDIALEAVRSRAVMIVLDMLFDFAGIKDELSYAGTRSSIGKIQWLADQTKALVVCSHHTPKYLNDAHNAANAALGSQGIAARFSPIILTRKWVDNLFTVESTSTRDPRGEALAPQKVMINQRGWIEPTGDFKEWMKWEIYAKRVLDLFEGPGTGLSVQSVAEKLGIDRPKAQNTLKELEGQGQLRREKFGRRYLYYLNL